RGGGSRMGGRVGVCELAGITTSRPSATAPNSTRRMSTRDINHPFNEPVSSDFRFAGHQCSLSLRERNPPLAEREATLDFNLNRVINHANGITTDLDTRIICPGAIVEPKAPGVPGTGHDPTIHEATAQRSAHVRAHIIDGEILSIFPKDGNQLLPDGDRS